LRKQAFVTLSALALAIGCGGDESAVENNVGPGGSSGAGGGANSAGTSNANTGGTWAGTGGTSALDDLLVDDGQTAQREQAFVARLRECGIITDGLLQPNAFQGVAYYDQCVLECAQNNLCSDLSEATCAARVDQDIEGVQPFRICRHLCEVPYEVAEGKATFTCDDGNKVEAGDRCDVDVDCYDSSDEGDCEYLECDGEIFPVSRRCDASQDCSSGIDEQDCPASAFFECADGSRVHPDAACDGSESCNDGSDEVGCPAGTHFVCTDGQRVRVDDACDGWEDCRDGSDELGCPVGMHFVCADGQRVPTDYRCDGEQDCGDGSDEGDCSSYAQYVCQ